MISMLKKYNLEQYLAFISIILFSISIIYTLGSFNETTFLIDVIYNLLVISFCVVTIIRRNRGFLGNKALSLILLIMTLIEIFSIRRNGATIWMIIPLFYIVSALTLNNKLKNNIITILFGIISINGASLLMVSGMPYQDNFMYVLLSVRYLIFLLLIFLLVYEASIKKSSIEQSDKLPISTQLTELRELLVENYITKEEFDEIKNSIIDIHRI